MRREGLAWGLAVVLGAVALWQGFQFQQLEQSHQQQLRQAFRQQKGEPSSRNGDLYLQNQVKNTLIKRQSRFRDCYNTFLEKNPQTKSGQIVLDWQVQPGGEVVHPEVVRSDFLEPSLGECLVAEVRAKPFPPPPSGTTRYVEHTFRFDFQPEE